MKYFICAMGFIATMLWVLGIWNNTLDMVGKITLTLVLVLDMLLLIIKTAEDKK